MSSPYLFVALICFISLLSLWFSGNSSCSVCNIKPVHPSVKCPLTSPLSHTRSISRWFQSHKVALSKSCFGRRTTEECVQHRHAHSITNTHRHAQAQRCTDSQSILHLGWLSARPSAQLLLSLQFIFSLYRLFSLPFVYVYFFFYSLSRETDTSACMLRCWSERRKGAWPQEKRRGGETFDASCPDRS